MICIIVDDMYIVDGMYIVNDMSRRCDSSNYCVYIPLTFRSFSSLKSCHDFMPCLSEVTVLALATRCVS